MSNDCRVLVIEDDENITDILVYALRKEGYFVKSASSGKKGVELFYTYEPDILLLDNMLPDSSGFDICKKLSSESEVPILMLTARDDIVDKILGLELGASDYITKPFDIREVIARMKVALRKQQPTQKRLTVTENIYIEKESRIVYKNGKEVKLKPKEFDLLLLFILHKNKVFSREDILDKVWDMDYGGDLRTVDVHVQRIRKKLDDPAIPSIIETVFGVGYKMRDN